MGKYYALEKNGQEADIYIFGDITSWEWYENDVSSYSLVKEIRALGPDVEQINVHINSYGGEVAEGLAIYNTLKNHKAKVRTIVDGFACSAASVVFMAGDERVMSNASLLMIHNAWMITWGDPNQLRKNADDLEKITQATKNAYLEHANITQEELSKMMDEETWILPNEALDMGFATSIVGEPATDKAAASARKALFNLVSKARKETDTDNADLQEAVRQIMERLKASQDNVEPEPDPEPNPEPDPIPEPTPEPQQLENKTLKFFNAVLGRKEG